MDESDPNALRFQAELEFVQLLSNPYYLNWLGQSNYFDDHHFIAYLEYLQYWKEQKYLKFIVYPQSLFYLEKLLDKDFRDSFKQIPIADFASKQQINKDEFGQQMKDEEAIVQYTLYAQISQFGQPAPPPDEEPSMIKDTEH
ncbi:putative Mediator of RNA polymerase II transcription subunit 31 [Blattamonas nauphoetae]|uniref:Mediator of RNA polymerase II transcription subunit 31 n=1 Tax=Blattamonas nauphoetae TaxID=2049346 RepID=A0ABQ9XZI6_9EUKA|nr:putative Mediator of RNA polymerase II transcription subunit 31 [Blattamonas nauphoetae]